MSYYSIYFSPTGGTKKVSYILSEVISFDKKIDISNRDINFNEFSFREEDVCLFAIPSFSGRVPNVAIKRISKMKGKGAKAILLVVFGNRVIEDTLLELKNTLDSIGFDCIAAIEAVAEHSMMPQFGTNRPDEMDRRDLIDFTERIINKLKNIKELDESIDLIVPGNYPYKEYKNNPIKPIGNSNCTRCFSCVDSCPVGAISKANPSETNNDICISCMRCIAICPSEARLLDEDMVDSLANKLGNQFKGRKENRLYL